MIGLICILYVAVAIVTLLIFGGSRLVSRPQLEEWQMPAGLIHLFTGDRHLESDRDNPFEHAELDWNSGEIGLIMSDELAYYPAYQPALIGTIQISKPESDKGKVAAIIDNGVAAALGLRPAGLNSLAMSSGAPNFSGASLKPH